MSSYQIQCHSISETTRELKAYSEAAIKFPKQFFVVLFLLEVFEIIV